MRSSRAGFYFFAAAKRSKQEMPSQTRTFLTMLKNLKNTGTPRKLNLFFPETSVKER
jgi:hypothetical protein